MLADAYLTINLWHVVTAFALILLALLVAYLAGDSHGYMRAPTDERRRADEATIGQELAEGREKATKERLASLEADYAALKGAAVNLAWVAQRSAPKKT